MTRMSIHGGQVDILCACGNPEYLPSSLKYGFRLNFFCIECDVEFALDVIEWFVIVKQPRNGIEKATWALSIALDVMFGSLFLNLQVMKNESQTIYR